MAKPQRKAAARLARRQAGYVQGKNASTTMPGSRNRRKPSSDGSGHRTRSVVKADSRSATS